MGDIHTSGPIQPGDELVVPPNQPGLDMGSLAAAYREILKWGILSMRNHSYPDQLAASSTIQYLHAEAEHLHNLPAYLTEQNVNIHAYYYCAIRPAYLDAIQGGLSPDRRFLISRYEDAWKAIREALLPFQEQIDLKWPAAIQDS